MVLLIPLCFDFYCLDKNQVNNYFTSQISKSECRIFALILLMIGA